MEILVRQPSGLGGACRHEPLLGGIETHQTPSEDPQIPGLGESDPKISLGMKKG